MKIFAAETYSLIIFREQRNNKSEGKENPNQQTPIESSQMFQLVLCTFRLINLVFFFLSLHRPNSG